MDIQYTLSPRTRGPDGPLPEPVIEIDVSGTATLTEALQLGLAIIATVTTYGAPRVVAK